MTQVLEAQKNQRLMLANKVGSVLCKVLLHVVTILRTLRVSSQLRSEKGYTTKDIIGAASICAKYLVLILKLL